MTTLTGIQAVYFSHPATSRRWLTPAGDPIGQEITNQPVEVTTLNNTGVSYWSLRDCEQALNYYYQEALIIRRWIVFALQNWLVRVFQRLDVIFFIPLLPGDLAVGLCAGAHRILNPGSVLVSSSTETIFPYLSRMFEESRDTF